MIGIKAELLHDLGAGVYEAMITETSQGCPCKPPPSGVTMEIDVSRINENEKDRLSVGKVFYLAVDCDMHAHSLSTEGFPADLETLKCACKHTPGF